MGLKRDEETKTLKQCDCSSNGSILDCDDNGDCICKHGFAGRKCDKCKDGFAGNKCDTCQPNYYNYPFCQGILTIFRKQILHSFWFQNVIVILLVQLH